MAAETLMFGIGATKAGTSWLYRYLASHPDCAMPAMKELHYFDTADPRKQAWQVKQFTRKAADLKARRAFAPAAKHENLDARIKVLEEAIALLSGDRTGHRAYLAYLSAAGTGARLLGDVTPSYGLLPEGDLRMMAGLAPQTRFIYILRDPLDRLWSNIRMVAGRKAKDEGDVEAIARDLLDKALTGADQQVIMRSDYAGTLARLEAAVPPENRLVLFFEQLFSAETVARICAFLGIGAHPAELDRRVHAGRSLAMEKDQAERARMALRGQYEAVAGRFESLPPRWLENYARI
ncbi:sulfotransferase family protein [Pseudoruegeria sp. SHC-113]|uniref:sulfotransferase family protein n=1 Tax=Pseudoruegeria sp. SHC-113 TaxID=2855439 RepID=UPI0021BB8097|nr:sulfotransferase [Pseudoruegeria sp. SHC-113]MCT8161172.1 sulfotransferase [Pseudoruegeria sp. SHC-113]